MTPSARVIKVAVLVTAETGPKDLSRILDEGFEGWGAVLQFAVEGSGWDGKSDLKDKLLDFATEREEVS